jgi:SOS-response transcriptional repressor LexA
MADPISWYSQSEDIPDIGTAGATRFIARQAGYLRRVQVMLHGAITGSTEGITVSIDNGTPVSVGSIVVAASAEGTLLTKEFFLPVKAGSNVEIINDGVSTGTTRATIQVTLSP